MNQSSIIYTIERTIMKINIKLKLIGLIKGESTSKEATKECLGSVIKIKSILKSVISKKCYPNLLMDH